MMEFKHWAKKMDQLEKAMEDLQNDLDKCTTPWESEKLEAIYTDLYRQYNGLTRLK